MACSSVLGEYHSGGRGVGGPDRGDQCPGLGLKGLADPVNLRQVPQAAR